jgi:hypothetical protein
MIAVKMTKKPLPYLTNAINSSIVYTCLALLPAICRSCSLKRVPELRKEKTMCEEMKHHYCGICQSRRLVIATDKSEQRTSYYTLDCGHIHVHHGVGPHDILWIEPGDNFAPANSIRMTVAPASGDFIVEEGFFEKRTEYKKDLDYKRAADEFLSRIQCGNEPHRRWWRMVAEYGAEGAKNVIEEIVPDWNDNTRLTKIRLISIAMATFPSQAGQLFPNQTALGIFETNLLRRENVLAHV